MATAAEQQPNHDVFFADLEPSQVVQAIGNLSAMPVEFDFEPSNTQLENSLFLLTLGMAVVRYFETGKVHNFLITVGSEQQPFTDLFPLEDLLKIVQNIRTDLENRPPAQKAGYILDSTDAMEKLFLGIEAFAVRIHEEYDLL
ncbi:hypothetical protein ACE38W_22300 [Chitinophaga sp. Hz27]|uniref:hypothetical protein n=1 Tax=Chitinophaga sp. Hz27 TaxID=3347169 RepID=UPI0035E24CB8